MMIPRRRVKVDLSIQLYIYIYSQELPGASASRAFNCGISRVLCGIIIGVNPAGSLGGFEAQAALACRSTPLLHMCHACMCPLPYRQCCVVPVGGHGVDPTKWR